MVNRADVGDGQRPPVVNRAADRLGPVPGHGSELSGRDQRQHTDPLTTTVSSVLVAGSDRFEVWARLVDPGRFLQEGDTQLLGEIDRRPGTEVVIDQTISVDDGDGRVWVIGHAITESSDDRVALIIRQRGRPPWYGPHRRPKPKPYRSWPGGGYWWALPDGTLTDLTRQFVEQRPG